MVRYTIEQRHLLLELYAKCGSDIKCQRKFRHKFPGNTVPSTRSFHELIKKLRSTESLLDKKPARKRHVLADCSEQDGAAATFQAYIRQMSDLNLNNAIELCCFLVYFTAPLSAA
jgi:hypothetical protein